jgi:segregation and condensation protein A
MTSSLAEDAIALLINMAEQGEIDPWDVKVIEVIDRFLTELTPVAEGRELYERNLSSSGQAFLYASMLVLLKADSLAQAESADEAGNSLDNAELLAQGDLGPTPLPPNLERRIRRRAVAQTPQRRRVTLTDLIEQLRAIAKALEDPSPRKRHHRPPPQSRAQAVRAIAQLAHQENLSEMSTALEQFFADQRTTLGTLPEWLDFELLLDLWVQSQQTHDSQTAQSLHSESHPPTRDRVGIFWALLLLSAQSKVELAQDEFYGALKIRPLLETETQLTDELA